MAPDTAAPEPAALSPFDQWMVRQNVEYAKTVGLELVVARLRAGGYNRVADAVEAAVT